MQLVLSRVDKPVTSDPSLSRTECDRDEGVTVVTETVDKASQIESIHELGRKILSGKVAARNDVYSERVVYRGSYHLRMENLTATLGCWTIGVCSHRAAENAQQMWFLGQDGSFYVVKPGSSLHLELVELATTAEDHLTWIHQQLQSIVVKEFP